MCVCLCTQAGIDKYRMIYSIYIYIHIHIYIHIDTYTTNILDAQMWVNLRDRGPLKIHSHVRGLTNRVLVTSLL